MKRSAPFFFISSINHSPDLKSRLRTESARAMLVEYVLALGAGDDWSVRGLAAAKRAVVCFYIKTHKINPVTLHYMVFYSLSLISRGSTGIFHQSFRPWQSTSLKLIFFFPLFLCSFYLHSFARRRAWDGDSAKSGRAASGVGSLQPSLFRR
jgi:hypothetical protein